MILDRKYHSITFKLFRNYYFELQLLYKVREFGDGVSVFGLLANLDFYKSEWDHTPKAEIGLALFNVSVFHVTIYTGEHNGKGQAEKG
jgi:hypothetical protein